MICQPIGLPTFPTQCPESHRLSPQKKLSVETAALRLIRTIRPCRPAIKSAANPRTLLRRLMAIGPGRMIWMGSILAGLLEVVAQAGSVNISRSPVL